MSLLRASFGICGILALVDTLLAQTALVEYLAYLVALAAFGLAAWWPDPLPPPPVPGQWSSPSEGRERTQAECSGCGREVDTDWSMCPYCSTRL